MKMTINDIIGKHYNKLYSICVNDNKVISQGRTPEDILNDVCLTALRKYKHNEIEESEGLGYLKKTIYTEKHFQYQRKKNELVIFTDAVPDKGYVHDFDN